MFVLLFLCFLFFSSSFPSLFVLFPFFFFFHFWCPLLLFSGCIHVWASRQQALRIDFFTLLRAQNFDLVQYN